MKIIVIGGNGTLGSAVVRELRSRHQVLVVGKNHGDLLCDVTSESSIQEMYRKAGAFDAVVCAAGQVVFDDFEQMSSAKYAVGLQDKLMGQVNVVLIGSSLIADRGSFTLISGIINRSPIPKGSSAAMVNGAIEGFVQAAAIELPRGIRINCVSPTVLTESMKVYAPFFRGFVSVPAAVAALAFSKSVEGLQTGQIFCVDG